MNSPHNMASPPRAAHFSRAQRSPLSFVAIVCTVFLFGCGASYESKSAPSGSTSSGSTSNYAKMSENTLAAALPGQGQGGGENSKALTNEAIAGERKIVYEAQIDLVVEDFTPLPDQIQDLIEKHGGYVSDAKVSSTQTATRHGRWEVRIPADNFNAFLDDVAELGVPEDRKQKAQDVTEEFVDLNARIANGRRSEERILQLLNLPEGDITDVIKVEEQLSRIRGEIERMEGRLRFLTNRTALTTVTINVREEIQTVIAPAPLPPTFTERVGDTWSTSLASLQFTGEEVALFLVGITPWLPVILLATLLFWFAIRKLARYKPKVA